MLASTLNIDPNQGSYKYYQENRVLEENRIERINDLFLIYTHMMVNIIPRKNKLVEISFLSRSVKVF